jgi:hypothetical protein
MSDMPDFVVDPRGGTGGWHQAPAEHVERGLRAVKSRPGRLGCEPVPANTTGSGSR